ncbi:GNAT family N-acetyltransferase [Erythrobacter sp. HL-111]|uniref:GNAT family N-acetyltransferase n=1 Tax=Erythrobacter sp. HL-111 TaxID=1798193 RepID=UPI0006DA5B40|nr:GNAT family protein [Erythrobacter sp. HL-111]KPP85095.1 MAG: acetyltransferase [Erythrobacteraceae bacterium HL-111]SDS17413.1 Protein N-acetyltransferase, RimJ/RimL family [Erythrobacter sp. HL-111]
MSAPIRAVPEIETPRFRLRGLRRSDLAALFPTMSDEASALYLTRPAFASHTDLWQWLAAPGWPGRTWIAEDRESGDVAGRFVAVPAGREGVEEIGYITCLHRQREGVARECTAALVRHLLLAPASQGGGARKIEAVVDTRHAASIRLLETLGFTREAHFREHEETHAGMCDIYVFALLAGEADRLPA